MKLESEDQFNETLELLGALLAQRTSERLSLVVCGGSALIALGLVPRATKDIDIIAFIDGGRLVFASAMPSVLQESANLVAHEKGLPSDWLNLGPASLYNEDLPNWGFPAGFQVRLTRRDFGPVLSIYLVSRTDQIFLKLYAAVDKGGPSQHLTDLVSLNPSDEELVKAAKWAMLHDPSKAFLDTVRSMLTVMEKPDVAARI
jgi:hypothetical protein